MGKHQRNPDQTHRVMVDLLSEADMLHFVNTLREQELLPWGADLYEATAIDRSAVTPKYCFTLASVKERGNEGRVVVKSVMEVMRAEEESS